MKQKTLLTIILLSLVFSFTNAECFDKYCWKNPDEMFLAAEQQFVLDMNNGLHEHEATKSNTCPYHMSSIAYGFSIVESGKGNSKMVDKTNNRFSVKRGSGDYQYKWAEERGYLKGSKYLKYPHEFLSTLDFMYLYKYAYSCKLGYQSIARYKTGTLKGDANTQRYYDNLMSSIQHFEKKYFGSNEKVINYSLAKAITTKTHGSAKTQPVTNKIKRELDKIDNETGYSFLLYFQNKKDYIQTKFEKNDKYISLIRQVLQSKYNYDQKFSIIKKIIENKNYAIEDEKYKNNILNLNNLANLKKEIIALNLSKFKNIYLSTSKINLVKIPEEISQITNYPETEKLFDIHKIVYKRLMKIISLNLGLYDIING